MKKRLVFITVLAVVFTLGAITGPAQAGKGMKGNGFPEGFHYNLNLLAKKSDPLGPGFFTCPSPAEYQWDYYSDGADEFGNPTVCTEELIGTDACVKSSFDGVWTVRVPASRNVIFVPRNNDLNNDNEPDKEISVLLRSGADRPGKGGRIKDAYPALTVTDWCTEHFSDDGVADGDPAEVMLPENAGGYRVYARAHGKPVFDPAWVLGMPAMNLVQDEYGNDLLLLGFVDDRGECTDADGNPLGPIDRVDTSKGNGKGKGAKTATDLTCFFEFTGQACYVNDLDCYYCDPALPEPCEPYSGVPDFVCCQDLRDDDGTPMPDSCGVTAQVDCAEPVLVDGVYTCEDGENMVNPLCRTYDREWIFDIADFVDLLWKVNGSPGSYNLQLRFYPN